MGINFNNWRIESIADFIDYWEITIINDFTGEVRQIQRNEKWMLNRIFGKFTKLNELENENV
jgi:hypothetical protein